MGATSLGCSEGRLRGVVGGEGVGVKDSSVEEDCSDGMSLLALLSELRSDPRRSRMVAASSPEEEDKAGDGVVGAVG